MGVTYRRESKRQGKSRFIFKPPRGKGLGRMRFPTHAPDATKQIREIHFPVVMVWLEPSN